MKTNTTPTPIGPPAGMPQFVWDAYTAACDAGMKMSLAAYCAVEVMSRINSGRSHDCDEWQTLIRAKRA